MTSLPNPTTIWICMDCGRSYWPGLHPSKWKGSTIHVVDPRSSSSRNCEGMPVLRLLVDPATTREGWLLKDPLGERVVMLTDHQPTHSRRVLVFDAPKETP